MGQPPASDRDTIDDEDSDTTVWRELVDKLVTRGEAVPTALELADLIMGARSASLRTDEVPPPPPDGSPPKRG